MTHITDEEIKKIKDDYENIDEVICPFCKQACEKKEFKKGIVYKCKTHSFTGIINKD